MIGFIGSGQEIHIGEEGGLIQWRRAIEGSADPRAWIVHGPPQLRDVFQGSLIRFHLAWGTDFMRENGIRTNRRARGYQRRARVKDPFQLRKNSYRVLLTRGRDGTVVFIPLLPELKETSEYLVKSGFRPLD